jgi:hypothetical protein
MTKPTLAQAFVAFIEDLEHAAKIYDTSEDEGQQAALTVVIDFLINTVGIIRGAVLWRPLESLIYSLEPRRKNEMRTEVVIDTAMRQAVIELLHRGGMPIKAAIGKVSEATGKNFTDKQLEQERKDINRTKNALLRWYYDDVFLKSPEALGNSDDYMAGILLRSIKLGFRPTGRTFFTAERPAPEAKKTPKNQRKNARR